MSFEHPLDKLPGLQATGTSTENVWSDAAKVAYKPGTKVVAEANTNPTCTIGGVEYPVTVLPPGNAQNTLDCSKNFHFGYRNETGPPIQLKVYGGYRG
jgi:hypothetical protein